MKRLRELGDSEFDSLISQHGRLTRLARLPADLSELLASHSIEEIVEGKRQTDERFGQLRRADPGGLLLPISIPVERLEQARQVELRRRELSAHIQGHELSSLPMLTAPRGIEAAKVAVEGSMWQKLPRLHRAYEKYSCGQLPKLRRYAPRPLATRRPKSKFANGRNASPSSTACWNCSPTT